MSRFSVQDAAELYAVPYWSNGYFRIGKNGEMEVLPYASGPAASIKKIVDEIREKGLAMPVVLRFPQIIEDRLEKLNKAFAKAIDEYEYPSHYQGVFPIKVNQHCLVVETLSKAGQQFRYGLEAGSKAELALCLAQKIHPEALLCCNGFKDDGFVRLALWGKKLGKNVIITLEKSSELERVLRIAKELDVRPSLGVRFKLHARGSGQWEESGGDQAKFGLNAAELLLVVKRLKQEGLSDCLKMLHCHVGSQVTDIKKIKVAVREATQTYAELQELGLNLEYLNVGGGLAIDYDGSKTSFYASANYTLEEYASDVVYTIFETCKSAEAKPPIIVSESGRAISAHHSVVVMPVVEIIGPTRVQNGIRLEDKEEHPLIKDLEGILQSINIKNYREAYHDAAASKDTMHNLFDLGYLSLQDRARVEMLFYKIAQKVLKVIADLKYVPDEFDDLHLLLADKYVANFSLFQSLPDHWAIETLFPIVPLDHLDEKPTRQGTIADISCDSDGIVDKFIDLKDVKRTLPLHDISNDEDYYLGVFLTGAYQDVLGSQHNLFGKLNEAHIVVDDNGKAKIKDIMPGQRASWLIEAMGYNVDDLPKKLAEFVARNKQLNPKDFDNFLKDYAEELVGYTYLE